MTTQTLVIRAFRTYGTQFFDVDNGPDHLRNYRWEQLREYLVSKGMTAPEVNLTLYKAADQRPDPYQLTLEV